MQNNGDYAFDNDLVVTPYEITTTMSPTTQGPTTDYSTFTINPTITSTIMESTTLPCKIFFASPKKN